MATQQMINRLRDGKPLKNLDRAVIADGLEDLARDNAKLNTAYDCLMNAAYCFDQEARKGMMLIGNQWFEAAVKLHKEANNQ